MKDIPISSFPQGEANPLRSHPDTKTIEFAGEERYLHYGGASLEVAEEEGIDLDEVQDILNQVQKRLEEASSGESDERASAILRDAYNALSWQLYVGMRPFETQMGPGEIKMHLLSLDEKGLMEVLGQTGDEEVEEVADASGNATVGEEEQPSPQEESSESSATELEQATTASSALMNSPSD